MTTSLAPISDLRIASHVSRVRVIEASASRARRALLGEQLRTVRPAASRVFDLSCEFADGGPWAGVSALFAPMIEVIRTDRPDLAERYAFELVHILPQLRRSLTIKNPTLTDLAPNEEKVRNYAADRAFRIVHGLIDLLDAWKGSTDAERPWVMACDRYDRAGLIGARFFRELIRRRGEKLNLFLILGVTPGTGQNIASEFQRDTEVAITKVDCAEDSPAATDPSEALQRAIRLEEQIGDDRNAMQVHLPEMIKLWNAVKRKDKVIRWRYFGFAFYCNLGLYADALRYGDGLLEEAARYLPLDDNLRWWIIIKTLNANTGMLDAESGLELSDRAQRLAEEETKHLITHVPDAWVIQLLYLTAMLYARYKQPRDYEKGEEYLERGLSVIKRADIPEGERHFQTVFNRNGLAMIRSFQGRHQEALHLCKQGIEELDTYLGDEQHRLHRSILNYNIAQVYVATGHYQAALQYFSTAMAMDPNYSEYYNERGNIYLRLGSLDEALADYLRAIELSPPYYEVFTNLGQSYRRMGRMPDAIDAYTRALDLQPNHVLALLGRANAYESLNKADAAIADYTTALERDPTQWQALSNRGTLHYDGQNYEASLDDFNRAIGLRENEPDIYLNRSIVLTHLGRYKEAGEDLRFALSLNPNPDIAGELQSRLALISQFEVGERGTRTAAL